MGLRGWSLVHAVVALATTMGGVGIGCAVTEPAEIIETGDPSLPPVDAGSASDPSRATGVDEDAEASAPSFSAPPLEAGVDAASPLAPDASPIADATTGPPHPLAGEVLITEVMYNPFALEPSSEWFEILNTASSTRKLSGLVLVDASSRTHVIGGDVTIGPGAYAILARDRAAAVTAKVPSAAILYEYGAGLPSAAGIVLVNNATGGIWIYDGPTMIARAPYGGWYSLSGGSSVELKVLSWATSAAPASWCIALTPWMVGADRGTPGAANDCPP